MVPQSPAAVYQRNGLFAAETAFQTGLDGVRTPGKSTPRDRAAPLFAKVQQQK
jgi:hypothetical protein